MGASASRGTKLAPCAISRILLPEEVQGSLTSHFAAALELVPSPQVGRSRLLELGAGHCEIARMLRNRGWEVHAADIDAACVAEARLLGLPATRLDLNEPLPFPARSFDFVVMFEVIEHVVRAEAALGQITWVLTSGGSSSSPRRITGSTRVASGC